MGNVCKLSVNLMSIALRNLNVYNSNIFVCCIPQIGMSTDSNHVISMGSCRHAVAHTNDDLSTNQGGDLNDRMISSVSFKHLTQLELGKLSQMRTALVRTKL